MGRVLQSPQIAELTRPVDLCARVIYFPVRHHSPACAWHVQRLIREIKPQAVLVEGPRDSTSLIPLLLDRTTRLPVAIYTTYVQRIGEGIPLRHAAYYPLCDYSPELAALRAAAEVGAEAKFIDLTFPEMVACGRTESEGQKVQSLQSERYLRYSRFLQAACRHAGARDADDLWDTLFEVDHRGLESGDFIRNVLAYCALSRHDYTPEMLAADGTLAREAAMAHAIEKEIGRVVVVTGGFHSVALPTTAARAAEKVEVNPDDALVVLTRYGFEQLDRLNGYNSGMPSPEFYQHIWEQKDITSVFVDIGRECRERNQEISVADEIAALDQCRRLSILRGHGTPSREDLLDGVRSCFVKGAVDAEGLAVLAITRQLLAGDRIGAVPDSAGQPPLVRDFRSTADALNIDLERIRATESHLDLYRRANHRQISRFFHRLKFLGVPFAELLKGPDFVAGTDLERIKEIWKYHWSPEAESALIERSLYGASLEEASGGLLMERFVENERKGQGGRADLAAQLVLEACRMGLHGQIGELLERTSRLVDADQSFVSLVRAMDNLLVLHVSREPLEAHRLSGISDLAGVAYQRACYLIPALAATPEEQEEEILDSLVSLGHCLASMDEAHAPRALQFQRLRELGESPQGNPALRGAALGLLYGDGQLESAELARSFRGYLSGGDGSGGAAAAFLRGLLRTARSAIWQVTEIVADLHQALRAMEEKRFIQQLPLLRLAFSGLTPRETDNVATLVAKRAGVAKIDIASSSRFSSRDMLAAVEIEHRLVESLARDQLLQWNQPEAKQ
jgi:hypothetical protein